MKISYNWLKEYIQTELSAEEIGKILTSTGLEVENVEKVESIKGGLAGVVVGEVLTKEKHPDADKLSLTTVSIGEAEPLHIVCGAPNVAAGQKVLVATVGSTLYPASGEPIKIKKSKIRGHESAGMICAEDELGLGESHDGILILDSATTVGTPANKLFALEDDYLLEIGLTPNRSDAMSHIGVARDLKAYLSFHNNSEMALNLPAVKTPEVKNETSFNLRVEEPELCPRYSGAIIKGVKVSESPAWLQKKLRSIGLKPINSIVDITNFVMHELGNPMHAFDLAIVGSEINVRRAKQDEEIVTLDGVKRKLSSDNLVICNATTPMCIAGVMGGAESGISLDTTSVFLEAAYFSPSTIRKTSKQHVLFSDSSFRFERGADPNMVIDARNRAIDLILQIAGGEVQYLTDHYPASIACEVIDFNFEKCRSLCGAPISNNEMIKILYSLDYVLSNVTETTVQVTVPTYRHDVHRQADLTEEILRVYGFNQVPEPAKLNSSITLNSKPDQEKLYNLIADALSNSGFYEIMNNSLTSSSFAESKTGFIEANHSVAVLNPLSNELNVMRQSLLPGGLSTIAYNQNRQAPDLKLYEFGKTYERVNGNYIESRRLGLFITGQRQAENWNSTKEKTSFYTIKSAVNRIIERLGSIKSIIEKPVQSSAFEDGISLYMGNVCLGEYGWIKAQLLKEHGLKNNVFYADLNWDELVKFASIQKTNFTALPKTQFVRRDFSLLLDEQVTFKDIQEKARQTERNLLRSVGLFDVYDGKNLPAGKKSYAVSFIFQDFEKTLQDEQVDKMMNAIRIKLEQELKAELR